MAYSAKAASVGDLFRFKPRARGANQLLEGAMARVGLVVTDSRFLMRPVDEPAGKNAHIEPRLADKRWSAFNKNRDCCTRSCRA